MVLDVPAEPAAADEATPPEVVAVLVRPLPALAAEADDDVTDVALDAPPPALAEDAPPLPDVDDEELPFPLDAELEDPEFDSGS